MTNGLLLLFFTVQRWFRRANPLSGRDQGLAAWIYMELVEGRHSNLQAGALSAFTGLVQEH